MQNISTVVKILLVIGLLTVTSQAEELSWPMKERLDLSSGYGDFRYNRFHTGLDLRTGARTGRQIYAPVSGYVYRIKTSYEGYGKALYLKGDDNRIYVFAHLEKYAPQIDTYVKKRQVEERRYYLDEYPNRDLLPVKKGALIAISGETGAGAPHLHFEQRTANNMTLNPLKNGFNMIDEIPPSFGELGVLLLDDHSLLDNRGRQLTLPAIKTDNNSWRIDTLLYLNKPFGLFVETFDQMNMGGMPQNVYDLQLLIDGEEFYRVIFDSLSFDWQRQVNLEYQYPYVLDDKKRTRRLYRETGNVFPGSSSPNGSDGIWGNNNEPIGHHQAQIIATDVNGNSAKLTFDFIWGPGERSIYMLDSLQHDKGKRWQYYFSPIAGYERLSIDSVAVFINKGDRWGRSEKRRVTVDDDGRLVVNYKIKGQDNDVSRLVLFSKNAVIRDNLYNGIFETGKFSTELEYAVLNDGLWLRMTLTQKLGSHARFDLYNEERFLGAVYPQMYTMNEFVGFVPPDPKYDKITRIEYVTSRNKESKTKELYGLNIHLVGHKDNHEISLQNLTLTFHKNTFYKPRFIELFHASQKPFKKLRMMAGYYRIKPEAFVCRENFEMALTVPPGLGFFDKCGISWYDSKKDDFVWLPTTNDSNTFYTSSSGGGLFTLLLDIDPPVLTGISLKDQQEYSALRPPVNFRVTESLSGIADDRAFSVKIDGQWLIPEYDPEGGQFRARPIEPLTPGSHHLSIEVWDRVGNKGEQYLNFIVKER